jgi:hypothetical protein
LRFQFYPRTFLSDWLAESVITTDASSCCNIKDFAPITAEVNASRQHAHKEVNASVFTVVEKEHFVFAAWFGLTQKVLN